MRLPPPMAPVAEDDGESTDGSDSLAGPTASMLGAPAAPRRALGAPREIDAESLRLLTEGVPTERLEEEVGRWIRVFESDPQAIAIAEAGNFSARPSHRSRGRSALPAAPPPPPPTFERPPVGDAAAAQSPIVHVTRRGSVHMEGAARAKRGSNTGAASERAPRVHITRHGSIYIEQPEHDARPQRAAAADADAHGGRVSPAAARAEAIDGGGGNSQRSSESSAPAPPPSQLHQPRQPRRHHHRRRASEDASEGARATQRARGQPPPSGAAAENPRGEASRSRSDLRAGSRLSVAERRALQAKLARHEEGRSGQRKWTSKLRAPQVIAAGASRGASHRRRRGAAAPPTPAPRPPLLHTPQAAPHPRAARAAEADADARKKRRARDFVGWTAHHSRRYAVANVALTEEQVRAERFPAPHPSYGVQSEVVRKANPLLRVPIDIATVVRERERGALAVAPRRRRKPVHTVSIGVAPKKVSAGGGGAASMGGLLWARVLRASKIAMKTPPFFAADFPTGVDAALRCMNIAPVEDDVPGVATDLGTTRAPRATRLAIERDRPARIGVVVLSPDSLSQAELLAGRCGYPRTQRGAVPARVAYERCVRFIAVQRCIWMRASIVLLRASSAIDAAVPHILRSRALDAEVSLFYVPLHFVRILLTL